MKRTFLIIALFISIIANAQNSNSSNTENVMENIQNKIEKAFATAFQEKSPKKMEQLQFQLSNIYKKNPKNIVLYWRAYLQYYSAIYYLVQKNREQSEEEIDKAVEWLEDMKNKNSEDYALLSLTQGFAIQFKSMLKKITMSSKIAKNGKQAIEKDSLNIRGYYAYASNDFYRPEKFGGGKEVEKYLLKAITLPGQKIKNSYMPSWGKAKSYEMLIKWYIRKENREKAKHYYNEAVKLYPNNYSIKNLQTQITKK